MRNLLVLRWVEWRNILGGIALGVPGLYFYDHGHPGLGTLLLCLTAQCVWYKD